MPSIFDRYIRGAMEPIIKEVIQGPETQYVLAQAIKELWAEMWATPSGRFHIIAARQAGASVNDVKEYLAKFVAPFGHKDYDWSDETAVKIGKEMRNVR
jgi:hypothetical protein